MKELEPFRAVDNTKKLQIGCCIDDILGGGIESKIITQIYGPPASGKTNICLILAINCVRAGKKVIFIDTEGGHSIERIKQIAKDDFKRVLENCIFFEPTNFEEQDKIIKNLGKVVNEDFGLIVLDSAVTLFRTGADEDKLSMSRQLSKQLELLREVAKKFNLAVIITNQVYSSFENGGVEPVGGNILKYWSKTIIELQKENGVRVAILRRHRSMPESISTKFTIVGSGLRSVE
jgi:DNA repair protein RadB